LPGVPAEQDRAAADQFEAERRPCEQRRDAVLRQQRLMGIHAAIGFQESVDDPVDPHRDPQKEDAVWGIGRIHGGIAYECGERIGRTRGVISRLIDTHLFPPS
jgi:hypothetical protein